MVRQALHPTTEMGKPILYSIKIDVTNKDWCPIPALLVIAQPQKPGTTPTKAAYSLGRSTQAGTPTQAEGNLNRRKKFTGIITGAGRKILISF